ncbi:hypothetical protein J2Z40_002059 [Cytobacillus eiseniae]|uniref:Uncharacterized protein n=1 Tax=Cytobacillus eiseniae TaxID=762947 RepID=A0ABS4RGF6_9BACI|nr:hypothetical protein [Cytobacillus eiseniae]MBP2241496.1 hypothetical protein [Cytobacillus eiseniae]
MDYIFLIVGSIVIITCFYFIIAPFFASSKEEEENKSEQETELPLELIYEAVNELEMDYLMKKITKNDFETMKQQYQSLATSYIRTDTNEQAYKPKKKQTNNEVDKEIIRELNKLRKQKGRLEG